MMKDPEILYLRSVKSVEETLDDEFKKTRK